MDNYLLCRRVINCLQVYNTFPRTLHIHESLYIGILKLKLFKLPFSSVCQLIITYIQVEMED